MPTLEQLTADFFAACNYEIKRPRPVAGKIGEVKRDLAERKVQLIHDNKKPADQAGVMKYKKQCTCELLRYNKI